MEEGGDGLEGTGAEFGPEVGVLLPVVGGGAGGVADDAEAEEGDVAEVAGVGDGGRLHVDGEAFGELGLNDGELLVVGDELVAGADEALADSGTAADAQGCLEELWGGGETLGKALNLAYGIAGTAPYIVVDRLGGGNEIHDLERAVDSAGDTGADDAVGGMLGDEIGAADGGIDFADAAFAEHYLVVVDLALGAAEEVDELVVLAIHCYD